MKDLLVFFATLFVIAAVFFIPTTNVFEFNTHWFSPALLLLAVVAMVIFLRYLYVHVKWNTKLADATIFLVIVTIQIVISRLMFVGLTSDDLRVKAQAFSLAGGSHSWDDYFYMFPNNVNVSIVYSWCIRLFRFFFSAHVDRYVALFLFILADAAIFLGYRSVKMLSPYKKTGTLFLLLAACFLPFYTYPLNFYTDPLMFFFPVLSFYLFLKSRNSTTRVKRVLFFLGTIVALCVGYFIKSNVVVIIFALVLALTFGYFDSKKASKVWPKLFIRLGIVVVMFIGILGVSSFVQKANNFENIPQKEIPSTAWIYMSLNPETDGQTNGDLYQFQNIKSMAERKVQIRRAIKKRVKMLGPAGLINHFWRKLTYMFSRGVMDSDEPGLQGFSHNIIFKRIQHVMFWLANFTQVVYVLTLVGFLAFAIYLRSSRVLKGHTAFATLSILGIMSFHVLFWESEARYAFIILMFLIMLGSIGLSALFEDKQINRNSFINKKGIKEVEAIGVIALALVAFATTEPLTKVEINQEMPVAQQTGLTYALRKPFIIHAGRVAQQTFSANGKFSKVYLNSELFKTNKLRVSIFDRSRKKITDMKVLPSNDTKTIVEIKGHPGVYDIQIKNLTNTSIDLWGVNYSPYYALTPESLKNGSQEGYYLAFKAFSERKQLLLSTRLLSFITFLCLAIILSSIYFSNLKIETK